MCFVNTYLFPLQSYNSNKRDSLPKPYKAADVLVEYDGLSQNM